MNRALFLDRDGIFNEVVLRNGVLTSPRGWNEIRHYPGLEGLSEIRRAGFRLILVTNQPDLERGIVAADFVEALHRHYREKYGLDAVYVCPFASNDHPWKKPNPGMFLQAAKDHALDLAACFHLGDTERDVEGARRCGCRAILWERDYNRDCTAEFRVRGLDGVKRILGLTQG